MVAIKIKIIKNLQKSIKYIFSFVFCITIIANSFADNTLMDRFNELFEKGKYKEAESLLANEGPNSSDPETASKILNSLRQEFLKSDGNNADNPIIWDWRISKYLKKQPFKNLKKQEEPKKETPQTSVENTKRAILSFVNISSKSIFYEIKWWGKEEWRKYEIAAFSTFYFYSSLNEEGRALGGNPQLRFKNIKNNDYYYFAVPDYSIKENDSYKDIETYVLNYNNFKKHDNESDYTFYKKYTESDKYATVTIQNATSWTVSFIYKWDRKKYNQIDNKWEDIEWESLELSPNQSRTFRFQYLTHDSQISPRFLLKFYNTGDNSKEVKFYSLEKLASLLGGEGKVYVFKMPSSQSIDLFKK